MPFPLLLHPRYIHSVSGLVFLPTVPHVIIHIHQAGQQKSTCIVFPINLVYRASTQVLCSLLSCTSSICLRQPSSKLCCLHILVRFLHLLHHSYPLANPQSLSPEGRKDVRTNTDRRDQQRILMPYRQSLMVFLLLSFTTRPPSPSKKSSNRRDFALSAWKCSDRLFPRRACGCTWTLPHVPAVAHVHRRSAAISGGVCAAVVQMA